METVNANEAKTHLSRLVEQAAKGKPFTIARAGKPLVKVVPLDDPEGLAERRIGFMADRIKVPADVDEIAREGIETLFSGGGRRSLIALRSACELRRVGEVERAPPSPAPARWISAAI